MVQKNRLVRWMIVFIIMISSVMFLSATPSYASSSKWGKTVHVGKYYLKYNRNNNRVYVSTRKNGGFKKTPVNDMLYVSNGKKIIYIAEKTDNRYYLMSYDIRKNKETKIKKLKKVSGGGLWELCGVRGRYIWLRVQKSTKSELEDRDYGDDFVEAFYYDDHRYDLYRYDTKTKSLKRYKTNAYLVHLKGNYYYYSYDGAGYRYEYQVSDSDIEIRKETEGEICTLTKNGKIKSVKWLGFVCDVNMNYISEDYDNWGKIKYLYFSMNDSHDLYRVRYDGKKFKKIKSYKGAITYIRDNDCIVVYSSGKEKKFKY